MNTHGNHHATPPGPDGPRPSPLCATYAPLLPLLKSGDLPPKQAEAIRDHLAGCAWCRAQLGRYDTLYAALRQRFDPAVVAARAPVPSAGEIAELSAWTSGGVGRSSPPRGRVTRLRLPVRFDLVAALLVVTLLAGLLAALRSGRLGGPPPLTAQERTYVAVLRADYLPLLDAIGADSRQCVAGFDKAQPSDKPQNLLDCRPVDVDARAKSLTLLNHLQTTVVPPRWQDADGQLKAWVQAQITYFTARIQAIDAHDVAAFQGLGDHGAGPAMSCPAISEIDAALPAESQLPVSASGHCAA